MESFQVVVTSKVEAKHATTANAVNNCTGVAVSLPFQDVTSDEA